DLSRGELRRVAWHNFRNHSKAYADLMRLPVARVEDLRLLLHAEGVEHLEAAPARGPGVLVISAHMGSWGGAAASLAAAGGPVVSFCRGAWARGSVRVVPVPPCPPRDQRAALDPHRPSAGAPCP